MWDASKQIYPMLDIRHIKRAVVWDYFSFGFVSCPVSECVKGESPIMVDHVSAECADDI